MIVTEMMETVRWDGEADAPMVGTVRAQLADFAGAHGMEDRPRRDLGLAVEEALTNVVRHAYPGEPCGDVVVEAATDGEHLSVRIADHGVGLAGPRVEAGIGTAIMRGTAQRFERGAGLTGSGTVVLMEFAMHGARVDAAA